MSHWYVRGTVLGHVFSDAGMSPNPKKVQVILDWPIPTSVTEVRQFLGLASYYRRYIRNFANVAAPLYSLTQANMTFSWNENCTSAFEFLKHYLMEAPVLVYPSLALMPQSLCFKQMLVQLDWEQS